MAFPDVLAMLCESMSADLGTRTVSDLPANFEPPLTQVVVIDDVLRNRPMNGPALTTTVSVDLLYFGRKNVADPIATLRDRAMAGSDWINAWQPPGIVVIERTRPVRRPDFNPNLLRFGQIVDFVCARF